MIIKVEYKFHIGQKVVVSTMTRSKPPSYVERKAVINALPGGDWSEPVCIRRIGVTQKTDWGTDMYLVKFKNGEIMQAIEGQIQAGE